jgi:hypothetical protein
MSDLNEFLMDELLNNRIIIIAKTAYNREISVTQLEYVKKCVGVMCDALKKHVTDWDELKFSSREVKIIETLSGSFISASLKIAFLIDEVNQLKSRN